MENEVDKTKAVQEPFKYGVFPAQLDGRDADGRAFYFRSRHGHWILLRGTVSDPANYPGWSSKGDVLGSGDYDLLNSDLIDEKLNELLGEGWVEDFEDYLENCYKCGSLSLSASISGVCAECSSKEKIEVLDLPELFKT